MTFNQPYDSHAGLGQPQFEVPFVRWFERAGFKADYATDVDLALNQHVLDGHRLLLIVGHNEYWTRSMVNVAQAFADSGGNIGSSAGTPASGRCATRTRAARSSATSRPRTRCSTSSPTK